MKLDDGYAFCESRYATASSRWHIRKLTEAGAKFGGGVDTPVLCGRVADWDIEVCATGKEFVCLSCWTKYQSRPLEVRDDP